jgi:hypothetical protein
MNNPFTSATFSAIWQKHFARGNSVSPVPLFSGLPFIKHSRVPLYTNIGSTHTKGVSYKLCPGEPEVYRNKVFRIFDVPSYFPLHTDTRNQPGLGLHRIRQYPGFLIDLSGYKDLNAYMQAGFSKSSRYKLNKYKKRLETSFNIHYRMYCGEMDKETYSRIFSRFRSLLEKRFDEKQVSNNNLDPKEWHFYEEVAYPMILRKKASLFVVYDGEIPIAITLNYLSDTVLFDAITVFDTDYGKFHLGSVSIMGLIEWCIANKLEILDFSKGHFDYKERWATRQYTFEYHIYYDTRSVYAKILAEILACYYRLKQYLREQQLNDWLHAVSYRLRKGLYKKRGQAPGYTFEDAPDIDETGLERLDPGTADFLRLKPILFDFLYLHAELCHETRIYRFGEEPNRYLIAGVKKRQIVRIGS